MRKTHLIKRYIIMLAGIFVMTFAISLTFQTGLGTTPLSTLPSVIASHFKKLSFGLVTVFWNMFLIALQIAVLRRSFRKLQLLQIPLMFVFSAMLDFHGLYLSRLGLAELSLPAKLAVVAVGVVILAFSISVTVRADVIMNSGEAVVKAFSDAFRLNFGHVKVALDAAYVVSGTALSLVLSGTLSGVGIGTVILAVFTGFAVNAANKAVFPLMDRWLK